MAGKKKYTKTHEKQLREYFSKMDEYGVVTADQWTTGSGQYTSVKALPPFVTKQERKTYSPSNKPTRGSVQRIALDWFERNPRRRTCLVLDKAALADFLFDAARGREF